jgi:PPOX class probable F420-dependent enzyme
MATIQHASAEAFMKGKRETMSKNDAPTSIQALCTLSGSSHTVLLTSFRRNGQGVGTPVGMMSRDGKLYFITPASTWKARRIAHNSHVQMALCTFQGQVLSPAVDGTARRLASAEARWARKLICVGAFGFLMNCFYMLRYPGDKTAIYEVSLQPLEQHREISTERSRPALEQTQK